MAGADNAFPKYKLLEDLTVGTYSLVKLGKTKHNKYVAVKILLSKPKEIADPTTETQSMKWIISESQVSYSFCC